MYPSGVGLGGGGLGGAPKVELCFKCELSFVLFGGDAVNKMYVQ